MAVRPLAIVTAPLSAATAGPRAVAIFAQAVSVLPGMAADVRRMADSVAALPHVDEDRAWPRRRPSWRRSTAGCARSRRRWACLTEIHATLGPLPPALEKLDVALDELLADLEPLQAAAERLNQLACRVRAGAGKRSPRRRAGIMAAYPRSRVRQGTTRRY